MLHVERDLFGNHNAQQWKPYFTKKQWIYYWILRHTDTSTHNNCTIFFACLVVCVCLLLCFVLFLKVGFGIEGTTWELRKPENVKQTQKFDRHMKTTYTKQLKHLWNSMTNFRTVVTDHSLSLNNEKKHIETHKKNICKRGPTKLPSICIYIYTYTYIYIYIYTRLYVYACMYACINMAHIIMTELRNGYVIVDCVRWSEYVCSSTF